MEGRRFAAVLILTICMLAPGTGTLLPKDRPSLCDLPADSGSGTKAEKRIYYNSARKQCLRFDYTGQGGNENNFRRTYDCQRTCLYT
uniref:Kunitz-type conkunitzin-S1 n=2 Tax=Conus striatus TaxID=6493 RepID=VKTS1_CONST|nr:RecName: Full=Kunitz-type conkunitzin-S1; Short=Conk-S1; Flags: Precursor [Conus striatus]